MTTLQLPAHHHLARGIYAMYLENRLGDVETDCRDRLHDLAPPIRGASAGTHFHGTHVPVEEPSTASRSDSCTAACDGNCTTRASQTPRHVCKLFRMGSRHYSINVCTTQILNS